MRNLAALKVRANDFDSATSLYSDILRRKPNDLDTLIFLAEVKRRQGRIDEMSDLLQQASAAHPLAGAPRIALARTIWNRARQKKVSSALGDFQGTGQERHQVLELRGRSQLARRDSQDAQTTLYELVRQKPDYAEGHYLLSQAYAQAGDAGRTRVELNKALDLDSNHFSHAWLSRSCCFECGTCKRWVHMLVS